MATPFVSRDDLADYLDMASGALASSDKALICVDAACDTVRTITEQTFNAVASETIKLDGTGTDALLLPQLPVTSVATVIEGTTTLVVTTDYKLNGNGVLLRMPTLTDSGWSTQTCPGAWTKGRQNISVTYSHGYADADIPRDARMVALSLAARLFRQSSGAVAESLGAYSIRYDRPASDLTTTEQIVLRKYRR